jgi:DNA-binding XRE family transcriptional regulator
MRAHTKKHPTDELVDLTLRVHRRNIPLLRRYAETLETQEERSYTVAETFPEYIGREQQVALRAYRHREGLTQKQLAELSGIPQHHISEMENGKRTIGKERAKKLAAALNCDYRRLL